MRWLVAVLLTTVMTGSMSPLAAGLDGGHTKVRALGSSYPGDSVLRDLSGSRAGDLGADLRMSFSAGDNRLGVHADYQLIAFAGDSLDWPDGIAGLPLATPGRPDDDRRWWDLTRQVSSGHDHALLHRLDRLYVDYSDSKTVLRVGRQALSWGNGLIYTPMDIFNPFDPAAVDTEYKSGDDMLYGQYLRDNGDDWQVVRVERRDVHGKATDRVSSTAVKYHGFGVEREFDLLVARHYDDTVLGAGGVLNLGAAVLRGDITYTRTPGQWVASAVTSWSYSWLWGGHNVSAVAEYFYNGFGLRQQHNTPADIQRHPELVARLARGELFTVGRHYVAASLLVEWTPLLTFTPSLFVNASDSSALAQLVAQWSLAQNWQFLGALNVPLGAKNTEYGGLGVGPGDRTLAVGPSVFAQLAWYF